MAPNPFNSPKHASVHRDVIEQTSSATNADQAEVARASFKTKSDDLRADRKLKFLKRSGLMAPNTTGTTIERATTVEDLRKAYRLVHEVYLGTGYLRPEPAGMRLRIFETSSETATFVAKKGDRVVGVLSVVGDSPDLGLPSDAAFKPELDVLRASGARLCEMTNQVVADEFRKTPVTIELMRCALAHSLKAGYDESVAAVSPSHSAFYDLMQFRPFGSERSYSQKLHDPVVALTLDLNWYRQAPIGLNSAEQYIHHAATTGNPFVPLVGDWAKQARRRFLDPELLEQMFVTERNFLAECTPSELQILQRRWGQELFGAVTNTSCPFGDISRPEIQLPQVAAASTAPVKQSTEATATPFVTQQPAQNSGAFAALKSFFDSVVDRVAKVFAFGAACMTPAESWTGLRARFSERELAHVASDTNVLEQV
jgi:hypothetical protein